MDDYTYSIQSFIERIIREFEPENIKIVLNFNLENYKIGNNVYPLFDKTLSTGNNQLLDKEFFIDKLSTEMEKLNENDFVEPETFEGEEGELHYETFVNEEGETEIVYSTKHLDRIDTIRGWVLEQKKAITSTLDPDNLSKTEIIETNSDTQTALLVCKLDIIGLLMEKHKITETQSIKLLATMTGVDVETLQRYIRGYKTGINLPNHKNKNNPDNETNQIWFSNLLNKYKIYKEM